MGKIRRKLSNCPNCNTQLKDFMNYCPECGQENNDRNVKLSALIGEFFKDYINLDSKAYRSIRPLLFSPGFLTKAYVAGKRASYIPPIRLYLVISLIFFGLIALNDRYRPDVASDSDQELVSFGGVQDTLTGERKSFTFDEFAQKIDSIGLEQWLDDEQFEPGIERFVAKQGARIVLDGNWLSYAKSKIPILLFLLMPTLAWAMRLFYRKRKIFYVQHLVYSLHLHTFMFTVLSLMSFVELVSGYELTSWLYVLFFVYGWMALRHVYGDGKGKTLVKQIGMIGLYLMLSVVILIPMSFVFLLLY